MSVPGSTPTHTAYIGLGSNLDNPQKHVCDAINDIGKCKTISLIQASSLYESDPMGTIEQPVYINAVVKIETQLTPLQLLDSMQGIEQLHGRERGDERWSARTLDLDILLYDTLQLKNTRLTIPHYGLHERNFVLLPLKEIAGRGLEIPCQGNINTLLEKCPSAGIKRLEQC